MKTDNIKKFAVEARNNIISQVSDTLIKLGYDKESSKFKEEPSPVGGGYKFQERTYNDPTNTFLEQWKSLKNALKVHKVSDVIEEVAYTWFNRVMAIKILGENGYIEPILDPLSDNVSTPILISKAKNGDIPHLTQTEQIRFNELILDESKENELFSLLFVAYCRNYPLISRVFGDIDDYKQLLLPDLLGSKGLVTMLQQTSAITKDDYKHVELIGWLYQFYISEKKDEVFAGFKKKKKADANTIPAATQIFTPNWIVKYMVENTVGQVWLDANTDSEIASEMPYYIKPDDSYIPTAIIKEAKDLKLLDPACGSGHILIEGFNILMKCYEEEFYDPKEAAKAILKNNLFGLDIDLRAAQLSRFAVLLIAAKADADILTENIIPHIYEMPEDKSFTKDELSYFLGIDQNAQNGQNPKTDTCLNELYDALDLMQNAKTLGSIMKFNISEESRNIIKERLEYWKTNVSRDLYYATSIEDLNPFLDVILVMTQKYEAVVANPPYLASSKFNEELKKYTTKEYKESKADLYTIFMKVSLSLLSSNAFLGMINQNSWMFLSSFESFRKFIISNTSIISLLHLGTRTFPEIGGEVVQNVSFILKSSLPKGKGLYINLTDFNSSSKKDKKYIEAINNNNCGWFYTTNQNTFKKIPGSPIAYWLSDKMLDVFSQNIVLKDVGATKQGLATGDNKYFLRFWFEINNNNVGYNIKSTQEALDSKKKWFPCTKGGPFRRWFGNQNYLIRFDIENFKKLSLMGNHLPSKNYYFKCGASWSTLSSSKIAFRYTDNSIFETKGSIYFPINNINIFIGYLNSSIVQYFLAVLSPTIDYHEGPVSKLPYKILDKREVSNTVQRCIDISKQDWDAHETSWNFKENELFRIKKEANLSFPNNLKSLYDEYCNQWLNTFMELRSNEEEINKTFIDYYNLNDEISYKVPLKDITLLQQGEIKIDNDNIVFQGREIMSQFISYLIACFMGRYRLDRTGLQIAYPEPGSDEIDPYEYNGKTFEIDEDGIIPLMDSEVSFHDNALNRIKNTLSIIFGDENQIDNINFIENQLGKTLEDYLVKDFYKDHCQRYSKRPIYWLFSSPKGAFKVLVYMHRLNQYTVDNIRQNYLLPHIGNLKNRIELLERDVDSMTSKENKAFLSLKKDLQECLDYKDVLKEVADAKIRIDLDDGVVVNYAKFKNVLAKIK